VTVEEDIEDQSISAKSSYHTLKSLPMRQDHNYASAPLLPNKPPLPNTFTRLCNLGLAIQIVYTILSEHVQPRRAHCALITIFAPGLEMTILTE
jgi:hypothetical protein